MQDTSAKPTPKVGQLFYNEHLKPDGSVQFASLNFIDEEPDEGKQWMYSQIAMMEDYGEGFQVYGGFEAGGMPQQYTRLATDEDLKKFIDLYKNGAPLEDSPNFDEWLENVKADQILLEEEKQRILRISADVET